MFGRRRRLTPEARRQEILAAAERLLRRGNVAVRVEDVVAEAGAAKGTFYTCFATWDDLLEAIRATQAAEFERRLAPAFERMREGAWESVLPELAVGFIDAVLAMEGLHDALFHGPFPLARPLPPVQRPAARIAEILLAGRRAGAYAALDAESTGALLFAAIHETADAIIGGAERRRALDALITLIRRAVHACDAARLD